MRISKKTKHNQKLIKEPCVRIHNCGHFVFNKSATILLEIEDAKTDGVVFGYENNSAYVAYSNEVDAYKGNFKTGESSFRFGSKTESLDIMQIFKAKDKILMCYISENDVVIKNGYKFFKLLQTK